MNIEGKGDGAGDGEPEITQITQITGTAGPATDETHCGIDEGPETHKEDRERKIEQPSEETARNNGASKTSLMTVALYNMVRQGFCRHDHSEVGMARVIVGEAIKKQPEPLHQLTTDNHAGSLVCPGGGREWNKNI